MNKYIRVALIVIATLILVIGSGSYFVYQYFWNQLEPVEGNEIIEVHIPAGSSVRNATIILEEHELIRNAEMLAYYIRWQHEGIQIIAGDYQLQQGSTVDDLLYALSSGNVVAKETIRFTVPEGYTIEQTARKLANEGIIDEEKFLQAANSRDYDFWFIDEIPEDTKANYTLEGFLFPETYEMLKGVSEEEIIIRMLRQFELEFKPEWKTILNEIGLTVYEAVILAAIVEREAVVDFERPIIAGVFHNRLESAWKLESCATVQYALGKQREIITFADLEVNSPFNTYKNEGLPPAPIANPGRASLKGTIFPEQHDYYFFVTKKDGTNEHHFSKTYAEHRSNDAMSRGSW
ncbi:endolytic transglycosylase MltG [Desulfuribacillus alkaliarsenatis]|uniref:Endolytic murein transglycosylase n=1 Tax=Desulfuribacillus alkaliarsenatis TaxID=766136 RepID=A0A1E5G0E6_9FIRM|nr:endolytic transglycosylase MltG [Desulfuribacillus alkaliarsenatis]OEF96307.1 hypothetical protein BHF68_09105 [Desulfuribacillus alkaliarsenatis]